MSISSLTKGLPLDRLEKIIRSMERKSGEATQLTMQMGQERYLVGDLTKREGDYHIKLQRTYKTTQGEMPIPSQDRASKYNNFHEVVSVLLFTRPVVMRDHTPMSEDTAEAPWLSLVGSAVTGYFVGLSFGDDGCACIPVGSIVFPLLEKGEKVTREKLVNPSPGTKTYRYQ